MTSTTDTKKRPKGSKNKATSMVAEARRYVGLGQGASLHHKQQRESAEAELVAEIGKAKWKRLSKMDKALAIGRRIRLRDQQAREAFERIEWEEDD